MVDDDKSNFYSNELITRREMLIRLGHYSAVAATVLAGSWLTLVSGCAESPTPKELPSQDDSKSRQDVKANALNLNKTNTFSDIYLGQNEMVYFKCTGDFSGRVKYLMTIKELDNEVAYGTGPSSVRGYINIENVQGNPVPAIINGQIMAGDYIVFESTGGAVRFSFEFTTEVSEDKEQGDSYSDYSDWSDSYSDWSDSYSDWSDSYSDWSDKYSDWSDYSDWANRWAHLYDDWSNAWVNWVNSW